MNNRPGRILSFLLILILPVSLALGAEEDKAVGLLALGGDNYYWIAEVTRPGDPKSSTITRISYRQYGSGEAWRTYTSVSAQLKGIAQRGDQLAAMLDNGEWIQVWPTGQSQGARLPVGRLIAIAGDGGEMWGLGLVPGGAKSIATQPSTQPTTRAAATQDTSGGPEKLVLLRLERSHWLAAAELPEKLQLARDGVEASMTCAGNSPVIAVRDGQNAVRVGRYTPQQIWLDTVRIDSPTPVKQFAVVSGPARTLLWLADESGAGSISSIESTAVALKALESSRPIPPSDVRAVTIAGERLRLLHSDGKQIYEQQFDAEGVRVGEAEIVKVPAVIAPSPMMNYISTIVMAALMFTIVSAIRQRPAIQQTLEAAAELPLATFGMRLGAGIVDALPFIVTLLIVSHRASVDSIRQYDAKMFTPLWIAAAVYIGHVMILELITGRSIGKMLFGLRVTDLEGQKASPRAIVIRNLLRIVDIWLMGVPLVLVMYSPLRQRAGDVAAGTLVLRNQKPPDKSA